MSLTEVAEDNHTEGQTDRAPNKLTFRIVDSPMGIGKSSSLMMYISYNPAYKED